MKIIMDKSFTIFPETPTVVNPSEKTFNNPVFRDNRKLMKFGSAPKEDIDGRGLANLKKGV